MKVAIVHNKPNEDKLDSVDILDQLSLVTDSSAELGYEYKVFPVAGKRDATENLIGALKSFAPDVIFNLFEGLQDDPRFQPIMASLFEICGLPYTGAPYEGLLKTTDKILTKNILDANGLPTPRWQAFNGTLGAINVPAPWIIKPAWEDGSVGIDRRFRAPEQAHAHAKALWNL